MWATCLVNSNKQSRVYCDWLKKAYLWKTFIIENSLEVQKLSQTKVCFVVSYSKTTCNEQQKIGFF